jgi:DNA repair ATPase RecN
MMHLAEQIFSLEQRLAINEMVAEYMQEKHITELGELRDVVQDLAQAQVRTEARMDGLVQRMDELAQAQVRTEARMDGLVQRMDELAQAQVRTEARIDELVQAQVRTEARIDELVQAQVRTEARIDELVQRMDELAQAQVRTEKAVRDLGHQLGGLSENLGGGLEDLSYEVVPYVLEKELGLELGELAREYVTIGEEEVEFNIYGEGIYRDRPGQMVVVLGEVKTNITSKELTRFAMQVERVRPHLLAHAEVIPLFFGLRARPVVRELARARGINLIFSYGKLFPSA